ncbi:hypothetical protein C8J56DRAFT_903453 [Mycena floridula]|nr:hypothetical protein C8J56DRAFT_903453 [Mycena floridula]
MIKPNNGKSLDSEDHDELSKRPPKILHHFSALRFTDDNVARALAFTESRAETSACCIHCKKIRRKTKPGAQCRCNPLHGALETVGVAEYGQRQIDPMSWNKPQLADFPPSVSSWKPRRNAAKGGLGISIGFRIRFLFPELQPQELRQHTKRVQQAACKQLLKSNQAALRRSGDGRLPALPKATMLQSARTTTQTPHNGKAIMPAEFQLDCIVSETAASHQIIIRVRGGAKKKKRGSAEILESSGENPGSQAPIHA